MNLKTLMNPCLMWLALPVVLVTFAGGCTKKGSGRIEYGLDAGDTLRMNLLTEPPTLDWTISNDTQSSLVEINIMDGLVEYNLSDPELGNIPALATEWSSTADARVWTFKIRRGVKWTDGTPFTAQQIVDGWERLLNPKTAAQHASYLFVVKNARSYNTGKAKSFAEVGVKVNADGNLVVELDQPLAFFPSMLSHHCTFPVRKDLIEKFGDKWTDPDHIQTLGAYKLKLWDHDKALVLERNEDYYGEKAKIKHVLGYMITEMSTALNLIDSGKLDFQEELPSNELAKLRDKPGFRQTSGLETYFYGFNTRKPPFNELKVRQAFVYAVNRKQITDLLGAGHAPLTGWLPVGTLGYDKELGLKFDPKRAAQLLDDAGYRDRSRFPHVTLAFNTLENHQRVAENVQAQIKKNLGIEVEIANQEWKVYLSRLRSNPPEIYRMGWLADFPDPSTFMSMMTSVSESNFTGWGDSRYDELVNQAASALNKSKRRELYLELQKILTMEQTPVMPIYSTVRSILISERLKDFPLNPIRRWVFKGVSFK